MFLIEAFDTLSWDFLIQVLNQFGHTFLQWILTIFESVKLPIRVNGSLNGYFPCSRGVRHDDPFSPLLFCIAKKVLNRGITNLILTKHNFFMASLKGFYFSSHVLYADDIFVFCMANKRSLSSLMKFLHSYGLASGQWINISKSHFFHN